MCTNLKIHGHPYCTGEPNSIHLGESQNKRGESGERRESDSVTLQWCSRDQSKTTTLNDVIYLIFCFSYLFLLFLSTLLFFLFKLLSLCFQISSFILFFFGNLSLFLNCVIYILLVFLLFFFFPHVSVLCLKLLYLCFFFFPFLVFNRSFFFSISFLLFFSLISILTSSSFSFFLSPFFFSFPGEPKLDKIFKTIDGDFGWTLGLFLPHTASSFV